MTSLVPALPGHVELQLEGDAGRGVGIVGRALAGAGLEVPAGPAGPFEGLHLAHEDAVHQRPGRVGGVRVVDADGRAALHRATGSLILPRGLAGVGEAILHRDPDEAVVSGQVGHRHVSLHEVPPLERAVPSAST